MSTTTRPARFVRGISSRALVILGVIALVLAGLAWGVRTLDRRWGSDQPVVVTAVNGTTCTVQSQVDPELVMSAPCPAGTGVDWTATISVGGLTHRPLETGLDAGLLWLWLALAAVGAVSLGTVGRRRSDSRRHERAAAAPISLPQPLVGDDDQPVPRDRWALAAPLPAGVPKAFGVLGERVIYSVVGAFVAFGVAVLLDPMAQRVGLGLAGRTLIDAVVVAAAGALVVRICLRSVRWSREGLTVRGFLTTGHYAWSDVDHVTAEASETTTKSGQYWTLVPALVLTSGERIRLGVFSQTEGGWFQPFRSSIAQKALSRYDILDAWLASASIPVDVAYEALRPWKLGRVSTSEAVALSDSPPAGLHRAPEPGSSIAAPQVSVAAAPVPGEFAGFAEPSVTPPAPRPRSSVAVRVLLILGALLVALPALFLVVGTPLLVYQLATGRQVAAVVENRVGDQCVLVDSADGSSSWTTRCLGDWQPRQTVQVVISSQGKPMTWVDTTAGLIALAVFCIPGVMLLTIGLLLRRRQRRHRPSSSGQSVVSASTSAG